MKLQFFVALTKDAIGYDKMEMRVKIESRAKILDKADGSNLSLGGMGIRINLIFLQKNMLMLCLKVVFSKKIHWSTI